MILQRNTKKYMVFRCNKALILSLEKIQRLEGYDNLKSEIFKYLLYLNEPKLIDEEIQPVTILLKGEYDDFLATLIGKIFYSYYNNINLDEFIFINKDDSMVKILDRENGISPYMGHTNRKTKKFLQKNRNKVICVNENIINGNHDYC
jgi:hypothetical protein